MRDRALPFKRGMHCHGVSLPRSGTGDENPTSAYPKPPVGATRLQLALLVGMLCVCLTSGVARAATTTEAMPFGGEQLDASLMAPPPTAAFGYSPGNPVTGDSVSFDGSASSCPDAPCTYSWADDPPSGGSWALGTGQMISFTFKIVGTKYVTLLATDASGRTASVEHNVVLTSPGGGVPTSTAAPQISGTAQQGETLTVSNGSWTGSPSSYAYQWQDCDSSGASCANISSATSSNYSLAAGDVGHTMRVVVTASNSSGSSSALSAAMGPVSAPPPPTAAFGYSPGNPVTGDSVSFDGSASSCPDAPCTYSWADDPPSGGSWALGTGQMISFTFKIVGTKYVTLLATDASGRTASVEHNVVLTSPGGGVPTSTAAPQISGTAQQGETLTVSNGSWSGSPTSYSYGWQDCDSSGSNCTPIVGATSDSYTLQSSDLSSTIRSVVTATNAAGSTSASSAPSAPVAPSGGDACDLNATISNFATQIAAANPGQVVCLASGDYSGFTGTSTSAPGITITSAPGAAVTFNSGMTLNLSTVQNFTLDGTGGGGTMTVGSELDMETSGDAFQSKALNLMFQNIAFTAADGNVLLQGEENSHITFNRDTFVDANAKCSGGSATGLSGIFYVLPTATPTTQTGLTVENSVFVAPTDLWNPGRAVQDGAPMAFENNVVTGFLDHTEAASCNHIDGLQLYSGKPGTTGSVTFTGNLCYDDYGCIMGFDGTSNNTITDNVCFDMETSCISLYADSGSVVNHNTQQTGGADPGGCATMHDTSAPIQGCTNSTLLINANKSGNPRPSGETYTNNIDHSAPNVEPGSLTTNTNNVWSGASSPNIDGSATFTTGTNPTTWAGFELTSGSAGHAAGSDGLDVGIRSSAGGPPTGSGSAPVNTVAPSLTGTATPGQTLTTTNGTWTITGNVPTVTTYQWYDCPTSTFSAGSCTPIQPQTAPTSANNPTYTLQASEVGDYVFSEVTVTNANGQINAVSNARGPVA